MVSPGRSPLPLPLRGGVGVGDAQAVGAGAWMRPPQPQPSTAQFFPDLLGRACRGSGYRVLHPPDLDSGRAGALFSRPNRSAHPKAAASGAHSMVLLPQAGPAL